MGCCRSKMKAKDKIPEKKQYSWDKRNNEIDPKNFIIDGAVDETIIRKPGTINGQQFVVQNCKNSKIYLLDHVATITVDDCTGCLFVIGAVKSSIFLRDCQDCKCIVACQQFRTRDCQKVDVFLSCTTQPIMESSARMRFGCYQLAYQGLLEQFQQAMLSVYNNNWSNIHDFTPTPQSKNWKMIHEDVSLSELFQVNSNPQSEQGNGDNTVGSTLDGVSESKLSFKNEDSVVPLTRGAREKRYDDSCLVVVFHSANSFKASKDFLEAVKDKVDLIQTKEVTLSPDEASRIFADSPSMWKSTQRGPVIGLEFNGDDCVKVCHDVIAKLSSEDQQYYASKSSAAAKRVIDQLYNFCEMQMIV
ncbi:unnamed protein product [Clavelina lepadiformis]|uniref:Protein XRP2 n=1 Tax=Clavelina lepadiformis TaxID=159417 RepID=A0ABP0G733_CLALP